MSTEEGQGTIGKVVTSDASGTHHHSAIRKNRSAIDVQGLAKSAPDTEEKAKFYSKT